MARTERAAEYVDALIGPRALWFAIIRAGVNQGLDSPTEWGQGSRGFGYRLAGGYGQQALNATFTSGFALALDEDNRYFNAGESGFRRRLWYAISSAFLARHDNGSRSLSVSGLAGPAAGAAISRAWQPASTDSAGDAAVSFGLTEASRVGLNVVREFLPRRLRKLLE